MHASPAPGAGLVCTPPPVGAGLLLALAASGSEAQVGTAMPLGPFGGTANAVMLAVPGGPEFELAVGVPSDAGLVGTTFTSQFALLDGGIVLSDAVATTILP